MISENMDGKISVIVAIYNVEEYLEKCLQSIINQTYNNLEIILVNDGSTDGSLFMCEKYKELDSRIVVVSQPNQGLVAARKCGLIVATGDYVSLVDGDDYIDLDYYEQLVRHMNDNIDFVQCGYILEDGNNIVEYRIDYNEYKAISREKKLELIDSNLLSRTNSTGWFSAIWVKLFRTSLIKKCYSNVPDSQSFGEDLIATIYCIMNSRGFICDSIAGYHYVQRKTSMTNQVANSKIPEYYALHEVLSKSLIELGCETELKNGLNKYGIDQFMIHLNKVYHVGEGIGTVQYLLQDTEILLHKKVVLYGAGNVGKSFINLLLADDNIEVVAWVDKKFTYTEGSFKLSPVALRNLSYDIILLAVNNEEKADGIKVELVSRGISQDKILWQKPEI